MSEHDPLCPSLLEKGLPDKFGMMERASCRCELILKVRNDQIKKITGHSMSCSAHPSQPWYWKVECDCE